MLSRCPDDPELEKMWIENVIEEGTGEITGTDSHKGLFIRFAKACGYTKEELDAVEPLPETAAFLDWRELLMYQRSWLELYACQGFCLEGTANERMTRVVNGLTRHYGFDRESEDIRYWTLHMGVDEEHMKVGPLAVERYAVSEPQQAMVRASVQKTLDQFWLAFDGIKRAYVDQDPLYSRWHNGK
jgi:pyrroloquinoline quinone (PQQ) biosynthesis protein C